MMRDLAVCNVCIKPLSDAPTTTLPSLGLKLHLACWRKLTAWNPPPTTRRLKDDGKKKTTPGSL